MTKNPITLTENDSIKKAVSELENQILKKAFKEYKTTYEVAEVLEVSQPTVVRKKNKYKIES